MTSGQQNNRIIEIIKRIAQQILKIVAFSCMLSLMILVSENLIESSIISQNLSF